MSTLAVVDAYLASRRALGVRLERAGRSLHQFVREVGDVPLADIKPDVVERFLRGHGALSARWTAKYHALAGLYRFAIARGYVDASPLPAYQPKLPPPQTPYVYSTHELQRLVDACAKLSDYRSKLQALTYRTLLLLLYGTGMRVSEALGLALSDVDLRERLITVRNTKFYKTRLVPVGPRLTAELAAYLDRRCALALPEGAASAVLCSRTGRRLTYPQVITQFQRIRLAAGIRPAPGEPRPPRLHDLRHSAAVHRVVAWYRNGADVQRLLPQLATYLGHVDVRSTQHYLQMTPELLQEANRRFALYAQQEVSHA
jgi:integrase/recombinase XerD